MPASKMRYRAKVTPLKEGRKQVNAAKFEYTYAYSLEQGRRNLMMRFPYPRYLVENLVTDPEPEYGPSKGIRWR